MSRRAYLLWATTVKVIFAVLYFMILSCPIYAAFMLFGYLLFGGIMNVNGFRTQKQAYFTLLDMTKGNSHSSDFEGAPHEFIYFASIYFLLFFFIIFVTFTNIFSAVVIETYYTYHLTTTNTNFAAYRWNAPRWFQWLFPRPVQKVIIGRYEKFLAFQKEWKEGAEKDA